jgi:hypothetical protein
MRSKQRSLWDLAFSRGRFLLDDGNGYPNEPVVRLRRDEIRIGCTVVSREAAKEIIRQWDASFPEFGFSEVKVQG